MDNAYFLSQSSSLTLVIIISLVFAALGIYHSKKFQGISNYLTAGKKYGGKVTELPFYKKSYVK